jgi:hypothetical protein
LRCAGKQQPKVGVVIEREETTESEIVDGKHGGRVQRRILRDIRRCQASMPVVRVHHLRLPVTVEFTGRQVRGDPAQQRKAPMIVAPVAAVGTQIGIAVAPVKKGRIDDVGQQAAVRQAAQTQRDDGGAEGRTKADQPPQVDQAIEDGRQPGQQDTRVQTACGQGGGQSRHDIGQAAGLDQRIDFRGDVQDAQGDVAS